MFRKMRRIKQQLSEEECIKILKEQPRGVLAVLGDDDYPYALPISFIYDEETGHLYFHGAKTGHKVDAINRHDKVSFCVYDEGYRKEGEWALNIKSVIIFGHIRAIENHEFAMKAARMLSYKFTDDSDYIEHEIKKDGAHVLCLELIPEHMTGKLVNES